MLRSRMPWALVPTLLATPLVIRAATPGRSALRPPVPGAGLDPATLRSRRAARPEEARPTRMPGMPWQVQARQPELRRALARSAGSSTAASVAPAAAASYPMSVLRTLSYPALVDRLAGITWDQIPDLFQYDADSVAFYQDQARVQYLIDALKERGSRFTAQDHLGIPTLVEVLRSGFYLGSYHADTLGYLNARAFRDRCLPAVKAAQANAAFGLGTWWQEQVVKSMGMLLGNTSTDPAVINGFVPVLKAFNDHFDAYAPDASKGAAVYNVWSGIDYDLTWNVLEGGSDVKSTPYYGAIDAYLAELFRAANHAPYNGDTGWLVDNAVYIAGYDGRFHGTAGAALQTLTRAMDLYGRAPWTYASAQAAEVIVDQYGGKDAQGRTLDWPSIQEQIKAQYLPASRTFDSGAYKVRAGGQVAASKLKTLIWAHKETRAQFLRALRSDAPVDPNQHVDDSLAIVVYDTPQAYKMNRFAWGLSTDNGGIYIESQGTFFTYERTPEQSIYSLEELFRHEGVHYLQGRFEEPGLFGDSPLYDNERLTWIDEGSAEFFAGSTRDHGVQTRRSKAQDISSDASQWFTVPQVVHATYGSGWTFYDYACAFVDDLYRTRYDSYFGLLDRLKAKDPAGYDAAIAKLASDTGVAADYRTWLQYLVDHAGSFPVPATAADYLAVHPAKPASEVYGEIASLTGLAGVTTKTTTCPDWDTFTLRGTYTAGASKGSALADWKAMDAQADAWLAALSARPWSGYRTLTCWFVNPRKDASGRMVWDVSFHGVLHDGPAPVPAGPYITAEKEPNDTAAQASGLVGPGVPVAGQLSAANPADWFTFIVVQPGTVTVATPQLPADCSWQLFRATDLQHPVASKGLNGDAYTVPAGKTGRYYLKVYASSAGGAYTLKLGGPLGMAAPSTANSPAAAMRLWDGVPVMGLVNATSTQEWFTFNVPSAGALQIDATYTGTPTSTWALYRGSDLQHPVAWQGQNGGRYDVASDKTGPYFIILYTWSAGNAYLLKVSGPLSTASK